MHYKQLNARAFIYDSYQNGNSVGLQSDATEKHVSYHSEIVSSNQRCGWLASHGFTIPGWQLSSDEGQRYGVVGMNWA